ncbi:MAG: hypothetical protein KC448_04190 [Yoonia sp.]|nr:hypothetical protein [Yoonia sp.]
MTWLISMIASVTALDLKASARQASRSAMGVAGVGLLFLTCWVLSVAGVAVMLADEIGVVPALFTITGGLLLVGLGVALWLAWTIRKERRKRRARVAAQRVAVTSALAALPRSRANRAAVIIAGLAALAFLARKPGSDADDDTDA